jgi:hypothetical protein
VGEWKLDGDGYVPIKETIDIFTTEGKYLYSFESDIIGPFSSITNDRLFSIMFPDPDTGDQPINVYRIDYNKLLDQK